MQIDLEPKDYRAQPLKGEPVFAPGGLQRIGTYLGFVAFMLLLGALLVGPYDWVFNMLWPRT